MNTKTMEQFELLDNDKPASVAGGGALQCVTGTLGSAGLGFLAGASAGTVTIPFIGSVPGSAVGLWSGWSLGAATFCNR
ncbi:bacteriocin class II family protein [Streptococcus ruminantium]|uniref:bacteriocin class II family protein n=1 Tax=Streptococcus ruminantium TaxID=1917441 RepID=UPI0012DEDF4F|nr:bacteriocin class II family protein [Streptococcus ruminantium]